MLDSEIIQELSAARAGESCTFVLEWQTHPDESLFQNAASRRDRLERLVTFYQTVKSPLLERLVGEGAEITDIPTSAQAIVTAPAEQWRALAAGLHDDIGVRVLPNRIYTAV